MANKSITIEIKGDTRDFTVSVGQAEDALEGMEGAADSAGGATGGMLGKLKDFASGAAAVFAGGALLEAASSLGAKLSEAFSEAMDIEKGQDKLAAQLGLSAEASESFGRAAGELYANAYGDGLDQVNEALRYVQQNIGDGIGVADDALTSVTGSVLDLADAFGEDLGPMTRAVGTMIKSGLVKDAQEGLDILTVGLQNGTNAGEDLLDTFSEYSTQFRELGISAEMGLGLMSQGMKAGARDSDTLADAIKEFAIRSKDGSKASATAFQDIGLNAEKMTAIFAKGGPEAERAMADVIRRLKEMKDPVQQDATAVALFGTKAEDLQDALYALDPTTAVSSLGQVEGAAARMGATLADNAATKFEAFKRQLHMGLVGFIKDVILPGVVSVGDQVVAGYQKIGDGIRLFLDTFQGKDSAVDVGSWTEPIKELGRTVRELADQYLPPLRDIWSQITEKATQFTDWVKNNENTMITLGVIAGEVLVVALAALAVGLYTVAAGVIAATWPVLLAVAALFAMVSAVRWAWENWAFFREAVGAVVSWLGETVPPIIEAVRGAIDIAFQWIANVAVPWVVGAFQSFIGFLQNTLWPAVQMVWSGIQIAIGWAVNLILPIISFLVEFIASNFGHIAEIARNIWDMIINILTNAWQIISNVVQLFLNIISGNWGDAWNNIKNIFSAVWDTIKNIVANGAGVVREVIQTLASFIGSIGGRIFEGIGIGFRNVINMVIDKWNSLQFTLPKIEIFGQTLGGGSVGVPRIPRFATGGVMRVPGGGAGMAILHDGERVIPPSRAGLSRYRSGGDTYHVHIPVGFVGSETELAKEIGRVITVGRRRGVAAPWENQDRTA